MIPNNNICTTHGNDSIVKFEENLSVMYIQNSQRAPYITVKIDGCDITTGNKCDAGAILIKTEETLLIELKGSDIDHAVTQLTATLKNYSLTRKGNIKCFIISSNNPNSSTKNQIVKTKFLTKTGIQLFIEKPKYRYIYT